MPPKRANPSGSTGEKPAKKAATTKSKASASTPKLKKSKAPNWTEKSEWSQDKPTGEWSKQSVERWNLLPPYDTSITEDQWKSYYQERSALDRVNTSGSEESKPIVSEELCQDTWPILRKAASNVAAALFGSALEEEHKKQIAHTIMGSLYFTDLWGNDEGDDTPREVRSLSRLYSPFGLGTSIDLFYTYHLRSRMFGRGERFASLYVRANTIDESDTDNPRKCRATEKNHHGVDKAAHDAITVFDRNGGKSKGTTAANIKSFEEPLFGTDGWLSPLKLTQILFAAGGVMLFKETDRETPRSTLAKFQYFQGESDGLNALKGESARLAELEKNEPESGEICIPQRLLLLARQDANTNGGEDAEESAE